MKQIVNGVCFVLHIANELVLMERCPKKARTLGVGEWFIPGGKIENGELETAALRREMLEELGVEPIAIRALPLIEGSPIGVTLERGQPFLMRPFAITEWKGDIPDHTLDEGVELMWFNYKQALRSPVHQVRAMVAMAVLL